MHLNSILNRLTCVALSPILIKAFQAANAARVEALIVVRNPLMSRHAKLIFELAIKSRLVSMAEEGQYVDAGGLISYGANVADIYRRAAEYVVEILKGTKPSDLPVKLAVKVRDFHKPQNRQATWPCYSTACAGPSG